MTDVIKSRLQTDAIGDGRKYSNALDCAIKSYRSEGIRTFFRGLGPTLCRAAPVNAMVDSVLNITDETFVAFETAMRYLG